MDKLIHLIISTIDEIFNPFVAGMRKPISYVIGSITIVGMIKVDDFNPRIRFDQVSVMQIIVTETVRFIL